MFKYLIILFLLCSGVFSKTLDISNSKDLKTADYINFINDSSNNYSYEDINKKDDLQTLTIKHIGGANGPFWIKLKLINNSNNTKQITLQSSFWNE